MLGFFKRKKKKNPERERIGFSKSTRVLENGALVQDPEDVYASESYKKAQRNAHLIVRND